MEYRRHIYVHILTLFADLIFCLCHHLVLILSGRLTLLLGFWFDKKRRAPKQNPCADVFYFQLTPLSYRVLCINPSLGKNEFVELVL